MEKPVEDKILIEAKGAHHTAQEILALMQEVEGDDPIRVIVKLLLDIKAQQRLMISRMDSMERSVIALERRDGSPG